MWIGVIVDVPEPYASVLRQARQDAGDPAAAYVPPHVTLLPPVQVRDADLPEICDHLREVAAAHPAFELGLSGTATFRPVSPVVFVALEQGWHECVALQGQVNSGILETDLRFPYYPHVTIAQEVPDERLDHAQETMKGYEASFTVTAIELYENGQDGRWRQVHAFSLQG